MRRETWDMGLRPEAQALAQRLLSAVFHFSLHERGDDDGDGGAGLW